MPCVPGLMPCSRSLRGLPNEVEGSGILGPVSDVERVELSGSGSCATAQQKR